MKDEMHRAGQRGSGQRSQARNHHRLACGQIIVGQKRHRALHVARQVPEMKRIALRVIAVRQPGGIGQVYSGAHPVSLPAAVIRRNVWPHAGNLQRHAFAGFQTDGQTVSIPHAQHGAVLRYASRG